MRSSTQISVWDKISQNYDSLWVQKYSLSPTRRKVVEIFDELHRAYGTSFRTLDIGCGTGQLIEELARKYPLSDFVGIDKSSFMIALAREKNPAQTFYIADAQKWNDKVNSFHFVVCCHSYPYYPDQKAFVKNVMNLVQRDGYAIFVQASINNLYDRLVMWFVEKTAASARYVAKEQFKSDFSEGFDVIEEFTIREKWYMPSICGFVLRRR